MTDLLIVRDRYYTKLCKLPLQWMSGHVWPLMRNDESLQPGYRHLICRWWSVLRWCLQPSTDPTENHFHSSYRLHLAAHVYWLSLPIRAIKKIIGIYTCGWLRMDGMVWNRSKSKENILWRRNEQSAGALLSRWCNFTLLTQWLPGGTINLYRHQ